MFDARPSRPSGKAMRGPRLHSHHEAWFPPCSNLPACCKGPELTVLDSFECLTLHCIVKTCLTFEPLACTLEWLVSSLYFLSFLHYSWPCTYLRGWLNASAIREAWLWAWHLIGGDVHSNGLSRLALMGTISPSPWKPSQMIQIQIWGPQQSRKCKWWSETC